MQLPETRISPHPIERRVAGFLYRVTVRSGDGQMPYSRRYAGRRERVRLMPAAVLRSVSTPARHEHAMSAAADHDYLTKLAVFRALH